MEKEICSKRKYTFLVIVEVEEWPCLPHSAQAIKDGIRDGILMYGYDDTWGFKNVVVQDAPIDILNTPTVDIKTGVKESDLDDEF